MKKIILASGSPRRREILQNAGFEFSVVISGADEEKLSQDTEPRLYAQETALLKASECGKAIGKQKNTLVISADTIVVSEGKILGKPKDEEDAFKMLSDLSGKTHEVITGFCVMNLETAFSVCMAEVTKVTFKSLTPETIRSYIETKEPMDKAGSYGIQGKGAILVQKIDGDYFNVVGLPISKLTDVLIKEFGMKFENGMWK
ncbi:MAG: Maf family protein [Clostridia bacterium]|nr:Maf family protein [Clostridia bacterium]